jgi:L-ascorbate metabolism protein UlaG (beta-lactamase superfamily)
VREGKVAVIDPRELVDVDAVAVSIWWLGSAGFAINAAGTVILIDPVIELQDDRDTVTSELGLPLLVPLPIRARNVDRADLVLITHDHGDHAGRRTVPELADRTHAIFVATETASFKLQQYGIPRERIRTARYGQRMRVGGINVTPTVAKHEEDAIHTQRGDCCGFLIKVAGVTIWHPGDTELLDEHLKQKDIDVLILPIAPNVLSAADAARLANTTRAKHIIPCHYGTYDSDLYWCVGDPRELGSGIRDAKKRYSVLGVGESLVIPAG